MPLRKELGILMGSLAFVHGWGYIIRYPSFIGDTSFWWQDGQVMYFWVWFIALMMTMPLLLTSNRWAIRKLWKNWKRLHRLAYGIVIFTILHIVLISWYKNPQTVWYTNTDILIQFSILIVYFLGKTLEWKWIKLSSWSDIAYPIWQKWLCVPCGYIYDPTVWDGDGGIPPGTEFSDIPSDWECPECGVKKSDFIPYIEWAEERSYGAIIREKNLLNPTTLELVNESEKSYTSHPGQFIWFFWEDGEWVFHRQYSIVEQKGRLFTCTIKLTEYGRGAKLLREISISSQIRIIGVFGNFLLMKTQKPKIFIATGTGLAPIYHMIRALDPDIYTSLYFSVGTEVELFYSKKLREIPNLNLHIHVTREKVEGCEQGRVDIDMIEANNETEWYLCGNPRMVNEAKEKLEKRWFSQIYSEEFS